MAARSGSKANTARAPPFHFHARFGLCGEPVPHRMITRSELEGKRLLVVDDNATAREILVSMARTFGFEADSVPDGREALRHIEANDRLGRPCDLVLMDRRMPNMDGEECNRLMGMAKLSRPPKVIMMTAEYDGKNAIASAQRNSTVEQLAASVAGTSLAMTVGDISRAVVRFDVDTALEAVRKLAESIESE